MFEHEIGAMIRDVSREIRAEHRDAERAAELAREIDQARRLLRFLRLEAAERDVVDRREEQAERGAANDQRGARVDFAGGGGEMAKSPHRPEHQRHAASESARVRRPSASRR